MKSFRRKSEIVCGLLQFVYGLIFAVSSFALLINWLFGKETQLILPKFLQMAQTLLVNDFLAKFVISVCGIFVGILLVAVAYNLLKKPYDKKNDSYKKSKTYSVLSVILNLFSAMVLLFCIASDEKFGKLAVFFAILTGIVAIVQTICIFSSYQQKTVVTATQTQQPPPTQQQTPLPAQEEPHQNNTTVQQPQPAPTPNEEYTASLQDFVERSNELFRLAKNDRISQETLANCLHTLMSMPLNKPFDFKINHLNKFTSNGLLVEKEISPLIREAVIVHNTSSRKKRIRFLEEVYAKGILKEQDYSLALKILLSNYR